LRQEVESKLTIAAWKAGLTDEKEISATIRSGIEAGMKEPRILPETNGKKNEPGAQGGDPVPAVRRMSEVEPRPVEWVWRSWIPRGALTLVDGDPGLGKSTMSIDLAARVSRGWAMPPNSGPATDPAGVLLLSAEDDLANTIRPRLDAAGADVSRVHAL